MVVALVYSAGTIPFLDNLVQRLPIIKSNRWWFIGTFYVVISAIFLSASGIAESRRIKTHWKSHIIRTICAGVASLSLLVYLRSPGTQYLIVGLGCIFVGALGFDVGKRKNKYVLCGLIALNSLSFLTIKLSYPQILEYASNYGIERYSKRVADRNKNITITENARELGHGNDYIFNDEEWLLKKIPFSHGYNNLGNPLYWYAKNNDFLTKIAVVTQRTRQELKIRREKFGSDNQFAEALMGDALSDMSIPTIDPANFHELQRRADFKGNIEDINVKPNTVKMRVVVNSAAYLIFNNVDHPGWEVYVNGEKADLVRANRIFQAVFLRAPGSYEVAFKFRPWLTIALISLPYLVIFGCLLPILMNRQGEDMNPLASDSRAIRYLIVGAVNTLFGYSVFAALKFIGLHYSIALLFATIVGVIFNFKTLGAFVFNRSDYRIIWRFLLVYAIIYLINVLLVFVLISFVGNEYFANGVAIIFVAGLGYFLNKRFVYEKN